MSTPECPIREYSGVPPCVSTHVRAAGFQLQRLKAKLGDKRNASSEVRLGLGLLGLWASGLRAYGLKGLRAYGLRGLRVRPAAALLSGCRSHRSAPRENPS